MSIQISYTAARAQFARLFDEVTNNCEIAIIKRRGYEDVALITASELRGLLETSYLLHSPQNTEQLLTANSRTKKENNE